MVTISEDVFTHPLGYAYRGLKTTVMHHCQNPLDSARIYGMCCVFMERTVLRSDVAL
jgi:hypothetical protein